MNDQPEQDRAGPERDHRSGQETSPDSQQTAEPENEVLEPVESTERLPKKSKMPPSRIAFLVFVVIAAVAIVLEVRARWAYTRTVESVDQAFAEREKEGTALYRKEIDKLVSGSPSRHYDEQTRTETFTWRGIRAHRLEVEYGRLDFVKSLRTP